MDLQLLWTIQLAPLLALVLIQLLPKGMKRIAPAVGMTCSLAAALSALKLFSNHSSAENLPLQYAHNWLFVADGPLWPFVDVQKYTIEVGFLVDQLNLLMITIVTVISFFVQMFSYYYMAKDASRPRYFAFLSFFSFSMTGLVLSTNLFQTFLFWELVGLTSYLLIGFWYEKKENATAARKAFVINRLGDLGFYLGIILLFLMFGSVNYLDLKSEVLKEAFPAATLTIIGILIFNGVMGKSAQFPFHNWLPDAMAGPTPVSALIHSATMVAAGVFLLARNFGLFGSSETTLMVILVIGSLTALIGASLATVQRDIKKIMAYSTISQLGLMVMGIGAGSAVAGMFHLATHAFFKSLLFLTAGAFIHHFHTNDIWEIGQKGGKTDKLPLFTLIFGLLSLSGIFPFAGFFSKDLILEGLFHHHPFFFWVAILVSFLTVYYSFRLLSVILFSKVHHGHHEAHHESVLLKICKALPLISLALISLYVGALGTPLLHHRVLLWLGGEEMHTNWTIVGITTVLIVIGAGLGITQFRNPEEALKRLSANQNPFKIILERKFFVDDIYDFITHKIALAFAAILQWFDKNVPNRLMVDDTSYGILNLGKLSAKIQNGKLQDYLSLALGVGVLVIFYLINQGKLS